MEKLFIALVVVVAVIFTFNALFPSSGLATAGTSASVPKGVAPTWLWPVVSQGTVGTLRAGAR